MAANRSFAPSLYRGRNQVCISVVRCFVRAIAVVIEYCGKVTKKWQKRNKWLKLIKGRLKAARIQRGLTLSDIETLTDSAVKVSSLSSYERGLTTPSCEKVELLARLYEVPMSHLCFCPYFRPARPPSESIEDKEKDHIVDWGAASEGFEITSREIEILRKILEKVDRRDKL